MISSIFVDVRPQVVLTQVQMSFSGLYSTPYAAGHFQPNKEAALHLQRKRTTPVHKVFSWLGRIP